MSVVLHVEQEGQTAPTPRMILKVYDRRFSAELREFKDAGPATIEAEDRFTAFVREGSMSQFLVDYEESGPWAYDEWDAPKREAYFYARSVLSHEIELEVYDRLVDMQGVHVPTLFADVRLVPQKTTTGQYETLTAYTETRALLMEYIPGFTLDNLVTEVPESDWAHLCDQAIEVIRKIADNDFINFDIKLRNIIVRRSDEGLYQVFYLDFGEGRFRDPSDSDEMWRERKRQKNEEGAVGYIMMNRISYAKGKKGKKYKGTLPLPWEYKSSSRFEGEYIELYENAE
jgi:serine/threonine protein kinase